jgi:hypothetical protein
VIILRPAALSFRYQSVRRSYPTSVMALIGYGVQDDDGACIGHHGLA